MAQHNTELNKILLIIRQLKALQAIAQPKYWESLYGICPFI